MSSAFKSTTKRTSIGGGSASRSHRRSRSLSRSSCRPSTVGDYQTPARRGEFVNTRRGAGFPDISLDDLALEIFESADRWRDGNRSVGVGNTPLNSSSSSQRRGRSVSRRISGVDGAGAAWSRSDGGGRVVPDRVKSSRRAASVARYRNSDSESEVEASGIPKNHSKQKRSNIGSGLTPSFSKPASSDQRKIRPRSMSHKDLLKLHDGYSSQSSALTDEEPRNTGFGRNGAERTIRTVYAQKADHPIGEDINTGLYNAMRKELRNAVEDIRLGLEKAMVHNNLANSSENFQPKSMSTEKNGSKLDQKQDLSDDMLMDGELDPEISKIVSDFLLASKNDDAVEKPQKTRKRSNDKRRMSKELVQEAEQYFEDFISNIEDTDLSSFEGERSDCGSCVGKIKRSNHPVTYFDRTDSFQTPAKSSFTPVEMDGVVLPWLQWETSNDTSSNKKSDVCSAAFSSNSPQDGNIRHDHINHSITSSDSCSPITISGQSPSLENSSKSGYVISAAGYKTESSTKAPYFDMDDYMDCARKEELTMETWRQQSRFINGSLHLCSPMFL